MSISTELSRIQKAKTDIKTAIEAKGVIVPSNDRIDQYPQYINQIEAGGSKKEAKGYFVKLSSIKCTYDSSSKYGKYYYSKTSVTITLAENKNLYLLYNLKKITAAGSINAVWIEGTYSSTDYINDSYNVAINYDSSGKVTKFTLTNLPTSAKMGNIRFTLPQGYIFVSLQGNSNFPFDEKIYSNASSTYTYKASLRDGNGQVYRTLEIEENELPSSMLSATNIQITDKIYVSATSNEIVVGTSN